MRRHNRFLIFLLMGLACPLAVLSPGAPDSVRSLLLATPALAQHGGHGSPQATGAEKPQAVKAPEEAPKVEIAPEQQTLIGVKTVKVSLRPLQKLIRTVGRIEADERRQATVNAKVEGWIEKLHVDYTGRYVKKGEALAEIYSPELLATQQEFLAVVRWAKRSSRNTSGKDADLTSELNRMIDRDAQATLDAARQRLRLWDISDEQIEAIEASGKAVRTLTLYSPVSGYVTQKMAVQGMRVMPGEKLFDVADLTALWVIADIYEHEISSVRIGQPVRISLGYLPGREFHSTVDYIYPNIAADTRTVKVRLSLPNTGGLLKPQMFAQVEIRISLGKRLAVPESAVIDTGQRQVVYVDRGDGAYEPREVQLGLRADGVVEVLRGLRAGEKVVASANFLVDSESQLKGVRPLQ